MADGDATGPGPEVLAAIAERAAHPAALIDADGTIRWVSRSVEAISGFTAGSLVGRTVVELVEPDEVPRLIDTYEHLGRAPGQTLHPVTFRVRRADGESRLVEVTVTDLLDDPLVGGFVASLADVTERDHLDDVLGAIATGASHPTTLGKIARLLDDELGLPIALAAEPGPEGMALEVGDGLPVGLRGLGPTAADGPWAEAARTRRPVVVDDATTLPAPLAALAHDVGVRALWVWPAEHPATGALAATITVGSDVAGAPGPGRRTALDRATRLIRLALERTTYEAMLVHAANHDPLTGAANRARFFEHLRDAVSAAPDARGTTDGRGRPTGSGGRTAVLYLDLDGFKAVNDDRGHRVGDLVLQVVTRRITAQVRPGDVVSRFGGDEFAVLCGDLEGPADAGAVADRLIEAVSRPIAVEGTEVRVGLSVGIAFLDDDRPDDDASAARPATVGPPDGSGRRPTVDAIMDAADRALYEVKAGGRGAWRVGTPTQ